MPAERLTLPPVGDELLGADNPFARRAASTEEPGPFRIGELSRRSGVAVGTIKYYLREGLLPAGEITSKTQALYGGDHLRRLRLIRILADVGGLSIAEIRRVTSALDGGEDLGPGRLEQLAGYAIGTTPVGEGAGSAEDPPADPVLSEARAATDAFVDALGFQVDADSPARAELAEAFRALKVLGFADHPAVFSEHARLAYELGSFEIAVAGSAADERDASFAVETVMVGSVVYGAAFMALRRMAHEHETRRRVGA